MALSHKRFLFNLLILKIFCVIMFVILGLSPSGKAAGSDPVIVGSNPTSPAKSLFISLL